MRELLPYTDEQINYISAKAMLDTVKVYRSKLIDINNVHYLSSRKQKREMVQKIEDKIHYLTFFKQFVDAETKLIEWAFTTIRKHPEYLKQSQEWEVFKEDIFVNVRLKEKVIDLALRLNVKEGACYSCNSLSMIL